MAATRSRLRKAGRLVLVGFLFLLLGVFLLFRPVLILPSTVESRISLDYKPPYPSHIELPIEVPMTISPGEFGMPAEHWGKRTVRRERTTVGGFGGGGTFGAPAPTGCRRLAYHGDKLTEETLLVKRDRTAPWNNLWSPWRPLGPGFRGGYPPGVPRAPRDTRALQRWVRCTLQQTPRWLCAWGFFWVEVPMRRTTYAYDAEGTLVEQWDSDLWTLSPDLLASWLTVHSRRSEPAVRTTRTVCDEKGTVIGKLRYEYGTFAEGRLKLQNEDGLTVDGYDFRKGRGGLEITVKRRAVSHDAFDRGITTWWAKYDMHGRLRSDGDGVAGNAYFVEPGRRRVTWVYFDERGCVVENEEGVAASRSYSNEDGSCWAGAQYDASGCLTATKGSGAAHMWRMDPLLPFATESFYGPNRRLSKLHLDRDAVGPFGALRTIRLVALLAAGPVFGITFLCLLDRLRGRRNRQLA